MEWLETDVSFGIGTIRSAFAPIGTTYPLEPAERDDLGPVAPRRLADYAAGRHCARRACRAAGIDVAVIRRGPGGMPIWPVGLVGSIAHGAGLAGAVVASASDHAGLGLDIEARDAVTPDLHRLLFVPVEQVGPADAARATRLFCAKEAVYKALWPLLRRWIGFGEIAILDDRITGRFRARPTTSAADLAIVERGRGSFACRDDRVIALFVLPA